MGITTEVSAVCSSKADINCKAVLEVARAEGHTGLAWVPWMTIKHGGKKVALVIRRPKKDGGDAVCRFCPFCGGDVSVQNQEWKHPAPAPDEEE